MEQLFQQILVFAVINSLATFGIVKTIKSAVAKENLHRAVALSITFAMAIIMAFQLPKQPSVWQHFAYGLYIGSMSVAVYEAAVKSLLELVPSIVNKFFK